QRRSRRTPLRLRLQPDARFESFRGIWRDGLRFRPRQTARPQDHLRPTLLRLRGGSGQQLRRRDGERIEAPIGRAYDSHRIIASRLLSHDAKLKTERRHYLFLLGHVIQLAVRTRESLLIESSDLIA